MALRYQAEATNLAGITYRINIYDENYLGATVIPFKVAGNLFELTYDGSNDDRLQYVVPSTLTFTYIVEDNLTQQLIDNLPGSKEGRHLIEVMYLNGSYMPYWRGVLFADQIEVSDIAWPQEVRMTASDDLKALDSIPYKIDENSPYTGLSTIGSHLINCVNKVRWSSLNSGTRTTFEDFFRCTQQATPAVTAATAIAIEHYGLQDHGENGETTYLSTYTVLAEILALLGLRMFQVDGAFMTQSIFAAEANPNTATHTSITSSAVGATTSASRPNFTFGPEYVKERGWTYGYLNPLSEVKRTYNFGQLIPSVTLSSVTAQAATSSATAAGPWTGAILPVDFVVQGDIVTWKAKLQMTWPANAALTGNNRMVRFRVQALIAFNSLYLKRTTNYTTASSLPVAGSTNALVVNFSYNDASWTGTSSDRVDFVTLPLQMNIAGSYEQDLIITAPALPSDPDVTNTGIAVFVGYTLRAVYYNGNLTTVYNGQFDTAVIANPEIYPVDSVEFNGEEITYRAINEDDNARASLELPETRIGDSLPYYGFNYLKALNGAGAYVPTETWYTTDDPTTYTIHRLNCVEMLSGQNRVVPTQYGILHHRPTTPVPGLRMHHLLVDGSPVQYFAIFGYTYNAYLNSYDVQVWQLDRELENISVPTPIPTGSPNGPIGGPGGVVPQVVDQLIQSDSATSAALTILDSTVTTIDSKLELIYKTFQPVGDDYLTTKITYEQDKVDGMSMALSATDVQLSSASGNSTLALREASPGVFQLDLQDQLATPGSSPAIYATGNSGGNRVGINNTSPTAQLDVTGSIKASGSLTTGSTVNGRNMTTDGTKLDGIQALAEVNQLAFTNISVDGTTVTANTKTATFTLVAGTNITLSANASTRAITINSSGGGGGGGASTEDTELFTIFWDH